MNSRFFTKRDADEPDPSLAAIEQRLERRGPAAAPAALRHRVLMAVSEKVPSEKVPATTSGQSAQADCPSGPDVVAGTFIPGWAWAVAAALGIALAVPVVAGVDDLRRSVQPALLVQLRAAGVADASLVAAVTRPPRPDDAGVPLRPALDAATRRLESRLIELRHLLEEML